jgi:hypothetical protein
LDPEILSDLQSMLLLDSITSFSYILCILQNTFFEQRTYREEGIKKTVATISQGPYLLLMTTVNGSSSYPISPDFAKERAFVDTKLIRGFHAIALIPVKGHHDESLLHFNHSLSSGCAKAGF